MTPGTGCYAFLLNPQGRIQADLCLFCHQDYFLIDTEPELREKVLALIKRYIIADQVELEDVTAATAAIGLEGPGAAAILVALGAPVPVDAYTHAAWGDVTVAAVTATGQPGVRFFCPADQASALVDRLEAAGAVGASAEDARLARIENGKPRYGEDIRETSLPQETQQMHAVSFTKGCYLGQEIVERIHSRGSVHRHLRALELTGPAPAGGTELKSDDGAATGRITSAAELKLATGSRVFALGMIRGEAEARNLPLAYTAGTATGTARILAAPPGL